MQAPLSERLEERALVCEGLLQRELQYLVWRVPERR